MPAGHTGTHRPPDSVSSHLVPIGHDARHVSPHLCGNAECGSHVPDGRRQSRRPLEHSPCQYVSPASHLSEGSTPGTIGTLLHRRKPNGSNHLLGHVCRRVLNPCGHLNSIKIKRIYSVATASCKQVTAITLYPLGDNNTLPV
jgi:hypothetical protein